MEGSTFYFLCLFYDLHLRIPTYISVHHIPRTWNRTYIDVCLNLCFSISSLLAGQCCHTACLIIAGYRRRCLTMEQRDLFFLAKRNISFGHGCYCLLWCVILQWRAIQIHSEYFSLCSDRTHAQEESCLTLILLQTDGQ